MTAEPADCVARDGWPSVSLVMAVLNEERHLEESVLAVLKQDYPGDFELVIALGPSRDRTDVIAAQLADAHPQVRLVRNPSGRTPAGLNAAVAAARHPVIARVDGHALLPPDYLRTAVGVLLETDAASVGGIMAAEGTTPFEEAVARAMTNRLGVGNAPFHHGGRAGPAETVYLGVFRREVLLSVGGYDEAFVRAQDWELNYRIRRAAGLVYFTPALRVTYRPRADIRGLARQYFYTGQWRRALIRRHPSSVNVRYLAPPLALVAVAGGFLAALSGRRRGLVVPAGYAGGIVVGSIVTGRGLSSRARRLLPIVYATMHGAWAVGFLIAPRQLAAEPPEQPVLPAHPARR
jgi:succinoglycan biosynthesis protein ExoA